MPPNGRGFDPNDIASVVAAYNAAPQPELLGLSPDQVAQLLDGDWRTVGAVRLNRRLTPEQAGRAWAYRAALQYLRLVRDRGPAPATAGGNLTRKFLQLALEEVEPPPGFAEIRPYFKRLNEPDVGGLHRLRQALVAAGHLRRHKGFRITKRGRAALDQAPGNAGAVFLRLFLARMGVPPSWLDEGRPFRSTVGPALYLLSRHAADWVEQLELTDRLLIPSLVSDEPMTPWQLGSLAYSWVVWPGREFGLLEEEPRSGLADPALLRLTPLFGEFVRFRFEDEPGRPALRLVR